MKDTKVNIFTPNIYTNFLFFLSGMTNIKPYDTYVQSNSMSLTLTCPNYKTQSDFQLHFKVNTVLITSFRFLQPMIFIPSKPRFTRDFSADLGTIHVLYPSFATVFTLFSILGTCKITTKKLYIIDI